MLFYTSFSVTSLLHALPPRRLSLALSLSVCFLPFLILLAVTLEKFDQVSKDCDQAQIELQKLTEASKRQEEKIAQVRVQCVSVCKVWRRCSHVLVSVLHYVLISLAGHGKVAETS